jgi:hypothetical protein
MSLVDDLIAQVPEGEIERIRVGLHWTAVVVIQGGERRCGLASTLSEPHINEVNRPYRKQVN